MRPSCRIRVLRSANPPSTTPSGVMTPARYISATTSMMPDPQIPVTPWPDIASTKPASLDHKSLPMDLKRGSSVSRSIRTRSMAPMVARCPLLICAPSKAGPVGLEHTSKRALLASTISALVPTSTTSVMPSPRWGASAKMTPAASAPTWPAIHGRQYSRASGCAISPTSMARVSIGSLVVSAKGAVPRFTGLMPSKM